MMLAHLGKPCMQRAKRQTCDGSTSVSGGNASSRASDPDIPSSGWPRLRDGTINRWCHMRQDLIARDQDVAFLAVEQGVFGRMPARRDHPPLALPHRDDIAVADANEFTRRRRPRYFDRRWASMIFAASSSEAPLRFMKAANCSSGPSSRSCHVFHPLSHSASGRRTVHSIPSPDSLRNRSDRDANGEGQVLQWTAA